MFSTFFESDLDFAVPFALLYGIDYIIMIRPKLGKFRATVVQAGAVSSCELISPIMLAVYYSSFP